MSITYSQVGPGYNDASLNYLGGDEAPVAGSIVVSITDANSLTAASADEHHSATVTVE